MERVIRNFQSEPVLKVNVANSLDQLDFRTLGKFSILRDSGQVIMGNVSSKLKWRVKLESFHPAHFVYSLMVNSTNSRKDAERLAKELKSQGYEVRFQTIGGEILINGKTLTDNTQYRVLVGEFNTAEDAKTYRNELLEKYNADIVREKIREPKGIFEVFDSEYEKAAKFENSIIIDPSNSDTDTILFDVIVGRGFHWQNRTKKQYKGPILFRVGDFGGIAAVCEIPIESYLKGVLSAEMTHDYPFEVLKSQAVVSRGFALANLGLIHFEGSFDLCSEKHCQLFSDISTVHSNINRAVSETRGEMLFYSQELCESMYNTVCGGYTEERNIVCAKPSVPYLKGIFDGPEKNIHKESLRNEKNVNRWVNSQPIVYCNLNSRENISELNHLRPYFRWEVSYERKELEEIIQKKTGEDIGILFDIIPVKRGSSGRLLEIEILGSRKNLKINRELNIRQTLSEDTLNSSCFVIEVDIGDDGVPRYFNLIGAGFGHGVGMCQTGAAVMAIEGKNYEQILKYYYKGAELRKVY